jgi:hypothetical protein
MKPIWKFRLSALLVFAFVGDVSIANLVAEFLQPAASPPQERARAPTQTKSLVRVELQQSYPSGRT